MFDTDSVVDFIDSIAPVAAAGESTGAAVAATTPVSHSGAWTTIAFHGGRMGLLDQSTAQGAVWFQVLDSLHQSRAPAYVEIDPVNAHITTLLIPYLVTVGAIKPVDNGVEVELIISQARHYLRNSHPKYERLLARLEAARTSGSPVAVTESPLSHEIIEVTDLPRDSAAPRGEATPPEADARGRGGDVAAQALVPLSQARQLFDLMNSTVCCPAAAAVPCIPFNYPDDGCWGRAHEMYRLMANAGVQANKVWIFGSLDTSTSNNPYCRVRWGWHVAPTLLVETGGRQEVYVIDPSLFTGPVPQATWAGVQGDPNPVLIASAGNVFYRNQSGTVVQTDPTFSQTNSVLLTYRNQLRLRATGSDGPPPYPVCLPGKAGVQFYGTIAAGATHSWFTYGWPANWHVLWTLMPLTTCAGGPQLTWRIRIERANATQATYWIVVTNTSSATVRFEGRYDILSR